VDLLCAPAEELPFHEAVFDVVTCLESLEFMRDQSQVLAEIARVLRPGGVLLITNRINTRWMPGQTLNDTTLSDLLREHGFVGVQIEPWQEDYNRVWARKVGESQPHGAVSLWSVVNRPLHTVYVDDAGIVHI